MQMPDVVGMLSQRPSGWQRERRCWTAFLSGNRDDQPRKQDGSIIQALNLMNNGFVERGCKPPEPLPVN